MIIIKLMVRMIMVGSWSRCGTNKTQKTKPDKTNKKLKHKHSFRVRV